MTRIARSICMLLIWGFPAALSAQLVTAPTPSMTNHVNLNCPFQITAGPADLGGGVTFTASTPTMGYLCYTGGWGLGSNGQWNGALGGYAGVNAGANQVGWIRFNFADPVSAVGGFLNYAVGYGAPFIAALDASNNVIDTYSIADIVTTGQTNGGAFRGISHASADIHAFQLANAFSVARDVVYSTEVTTTPEPASIVLMITGLVGVFGAARRSRSVSSST